MQKKKTYKMVGVFVLVGFICLGAIILRYMNQKFFTGDKDLVVMYFEESIQGLSVGSQVLFKGVEVGQVAKINLLVDMENGTFKTPVFIKFQENKSFQVKESHRVTPQEELDFLIEKGLRARLISASILTGQLAIELVMKPSSEVDLRGSGEHLEIPTEMSSFGVISKDLQEIPLKETMLRLSDIVKKIDESLPDILDNVEEELPKIMSDLNERLPKILDNLEQITKKMNSTIDKKSFETSKAISNFNATMEDMGKASISIKNLADYLERHPEAILRGKEDNK